MNDIWQRVVDNLFGRLDGPLHFRIILQPVMATILAIIGGIKDAKLGKPPYLWGLFSGPEYRQEFLQDGWKHGGRIFMVAIMLELIYQPLVLHAFYPGEMLIVAFVLAIVPYVLVRGPANRIAQPFLKNKTMPGSAPAGVGSPAKGKHA